MLCHYQVVPTSIFVVKKSCTDEIDFDRTLKLGQDVDLIIRFAGTGHKVHMIPDVLAVYDDSETDGRVSRGDHG